MRKPKNKVLIDCSAIHTGGGLQVALSFINDLPEDNSLHDLNLYMSKEIEDALIKKNSDYRKSFKTVKVKYRNILFEILLNFNWYRNFDIVFCLFGPAYFIFKPRRLISGFARPSLIYPEMDYNQLYIKRVMQRIKNTVHYLLLMRSDEFIVETKRVRDLLRSKLRNGNRDKKISVVYNCLSQEFVQAKSDRATYCKNFDKSVDSVNFLYVGSNYAHKNLNILSTVFDELKNILHINIRLFVTMSDNDFDALNDNLKTYCHNLGYVNPGSLQSLMGQCDALLFPTLLECFSITPIEAMYCELPIICSDRPFIREFCKDTPFYFEPHDSSSITNAILDFINSDERRLNDKTAKGRTLAMSYDNSLIRTNKYLKRLEK